MAIAHTGLQNGDVMFDPEMVFRYDDEGKAAHVDTRLKAELKSFGRMWLPNIREQGLFSPEVQREIFE